IRDPLVTGVQTCALPISAAGAALNAGSNQALTAHFVPDDASNYDLPSDTTVHINVLKATASVTPHDASKTYGADDPTFTGSVTEIGRASCRERDAAVGRG